MQIERISKKIKSSLGLTLTLVLIAWSISAYCLFWHARFIISTRSPPPFRLTSLYNGCVDTPACFFTPLVTLLSVFPIFSHNYCTHIGWIRIRIFKQFNSSITVSFDYDQQTMNFGVHIWCNLPIHFNNSLQMATVYSEFLRNHTAQFVDLDHHFWKFWILLTLIPTETIAFSSNLTSHLYTQHKMYMLTDSESCLRWIFSLTICSVYLFFFFFILVILYHLFWANLNIHLDLSFRVL